MLLGEWDTVLMCWPPQKDTLNNFRTTVRYVRFRRRSPNFQLLRHTDSLFSLSVILAFLDLDPDC